jgi:outer membrane protein assembly factor BamB
VIYTPARDIDDSSAVRPVFQSSGIRSFVAAMIMGALMGAIIVTGGCQTVTKPATIAVVPAQSFVQNWVAKLPQTKTDPVSNLYLRGDTLYAYTRSNEVYGFSATGGTLVFSNQVVPAISTLRAPTLLPDHKIVFPAGDSLEEYDHTGRRLHSFSLEKPTHSSGVAVGYTLYVGVDSPTGGRLAALDLTPRAPTPDQIATATKMNIALGPEINRLDTKWEVLTIAGIEAAPVFYQGIIYVGTLDGKIWAINEEGAGIWSLPDGSHVFQAAGPIHADLKVDEVGVYAASTDGSLYCVDRASGRVKWTYFGGAPLDASPVLTTTTIYQAVPGTGLVAIDKHSLGLAKAKWVTPNAVSCLSEDSKYVYAVENDGYLMAIDKTDGSVAFRGARHDLTAFAADPKGKIPGIFTATADGALIGALPVFRPGTMGLLVMDTIPEPFQIWMQ